MIKIAPRSIPIPPIEILAVDIGSYLAPDFTSAHRTQTDTAARAPCRHMPEVAFALIVALPDFAVTATPGINALIAKCNYRIEEKDFFQNSKLNAQRVMPLYRAQKPADGLWAFSLCPGHCKRPSARQRRLQSVLYIKISGGAGEADSSRSHCPCAVFMRWHPQQAWSAAGSPL